MLYSSMDLLASYKAWFLQIFCLPACLTFRISVAWATELWTPQAALLTVQAAPACNSGSKRRWEGDKGEENAEIV